MPIQILHFHSGLYGTTSAFKHKLFILLSVHYLFGALAGLIEVPAAVQ